MRAVILTVIACAIWTLGCDKKSANDQTLKTDVQAKLYADQITKPANVNVTSKDGVVTLSGNVASSDVELEAMKIASSTPGVAKVNDQIKISGVVAASIPPDSSGTAAAPSAPTPPPSPQPSSSPTPNAQSTGPSGPPTPPVPVSVKIPAGERVTVRTIDGINSAQNTAGQVFRASLDEPLVLHRRVIVPTGVPVLIRLENSESAGRIRGRSELELRLSRLDYRGREYPVRTTTVEESGKARGKQTGIRTGIGAAAGAIIGAIAGGGKGAAIGSAAGGGAGFGTDLFTHGQQVKIPPETILTFRLEAPLTIEEQR